jgi:hypothetical protein
MSAPDMAEMSAEEPPMTREEAENITVTSLCADCGIACWPFEQYMVHDDVWAVSGMEPRGGDLCVGCLEERIDRALVASDFPAVPINDSREVDTVRLRVAKGSGRCSEPMYEMAAVAVAELGADVDSAATMLGLSPSLLETWVQDRREAMEVLSAA